MLSDNLLSSEIIIEISNDALLRKIISMMADPEEDICELAKKKIETAPYQNTQLLVESLAVPNRRIRKAIFNLLESNPIPSSTIDEINILSVK